MATSKHSFRASLAFGVLLQLFAVCFAQEPPHHLRKIAFEEEKRKSSNFHLGLPQGGSFYTPCWPYDVSDDEGKPVVCGRVEDLWLRKKGDPKNLATFGAGYSVRDGEIVPVVGFLYRVGKCRNL